MCGITGWISFDSDLRTQRDILEAMTATMANRGPDAEGIWIERHAGLGHRRLAIIDLANGAQPMVAHTEQGATSLTFSGEIYNYRELRSQLRQCGHVFRTNSDTEVILRGYLEWQEEIAHRLNGMFAFAIWDDRQQSLVLVRDRLGIKPLYYYPMDEGLLFGSEPKAILAHPHASAVVEMDGLRELFTFSKSPGAAVWAGMREVLPGSIVTFDRSGLQEKKYWTLRAIEHHDDQATTVANIHELLTDVVDHQLVSDVPKCVLLSGGLDSSAIASIASKRLARNNDCVHTYSLDISGPSGSFTVPNREHDTPDTPYAKAVAEFIGARHDVISVNATEVADPALRRKTIDAKDLPTGFLDLDNSLYLLLKAIRSESTVALSGEAADEVFGGQKWFHDTGAIHADTFPWVAAPTRFRLDHHDPSVSPAWYLAEPFRTSLHAAEYVRGQYASALAEVPHIDNADPQERRMREVCYLYLTRFLPLLLDRKDRVSMAVGLEVRVPYCDHRLVEYVFNSPWRLKNFDGREKSLLRSALSDQLPGPVKWRVKTPFPAMRDPAYLLLLRQQVVELLHKREHILFEMFDKSRIESAMKTFGDNVPPALHLTFERILDMAMWLEVRKPALRLESLHTH